MTGAKARFMSILLSCTAMAQRVVLDGADAGLPLLTAAQYITVFGDPLAKRLMKLDLELYVHSRALS